MADPEQTKIRIDRYKTHVGWSTRRVRLQIVRRDASGRALQHIDVAVTEYAFLRALRDAGWSVTLRETP